MDHLGLSKGILTILTFKLISLLLAACQFRHPFKRNCCQNRAAPHIICVSFYIDGDKAFFSFFISTFLPMTFKANIDLSHYYGCFPQSTRKSMAFKSVISLCVCVREAALCIHVCTSECACSYSNKAQPVSWTAEKIMSHQCQNIMQSNTSEKQNTHTPSQLQPQRYHGAVHLWTLTTTNTCLCVFLSVTVCTVSPLPKALHNTGQGHCIGAIQCFQTSVLNPADRINPCLP